MHLENLTIRSFRCLREFESDLPPGRIVVVGDNAKGKTSLLEAVFYLVTGRSFRTRYDNDCLPWSSEPGATATIRGRVRRASEGDSCRLAVTIAAGTKAVRIDDQPIERLGELWGRLHAVLFTPDDLQLVKGGPGERRRYLDVGLSQISHDFLFHLQRYSQALRQRNALLKQNDMNLDDLRSHVAPWDMQLVEHGVPIFQARHEFILALEPRAARLYDGIADRAGDATPDGPEALRLRYSNFLKTDGPIDPAQARTLFHRALERGLDDDLRRGQTETGPHRDELVVLLGGKPARDFASQGQVRSCVLALRLAEVIEMQSRTGESPIVLLDDLASELDPARKERVLSLLDPAWQTFLTTTRESDFPAGSEFDLTIRLA
ncbi:DNA replication/repair protein RecF [Candidatus Sumerlaeota bacterium]|nr:DNA replication/repair protein RecF [Candidatus Sumerlaeota bacterium]